LSIRSIHVKSSTYLGKETRNEAEATYMRSLRTCDAGAHIARYYIM